LGFNQIDFSKELGISQANLSKLENGIVMPSALLWLKVCELGSIPYDSLK
jgi:transcriptional regulator with XRE-family HTH domain